MTRNSTRKPQESQTPQTGAQEDLAAQLAALQAELAQARQEAEEARAAAEAAKARKTRERHITPKQQRLVNYLHEHPEASIAEACTAAGATATSHGLVFRMIEDGYLKVSPAAPAAEVKPESDSSGESGESTESGEKPESAEAGESGEKPESPEATQAA